MSTRVMKKFESVADGIDNMVAAAKYDYTLSNFNEQMNERQLRAVQRILEEGPKGFEGGMNARKYIGITKTSKATATRDLQDLVGKGIFIPIGGGRSTRYELALEVE